MTRAQPSNPAGYRGRVFTAALFAVVGAAAASPGTAPRVGTPAQGAVPLRGVTITVSLEAHARNGEMALPRVTAVDRVTVGGRTDRTVGAGPAGTRDICDVQVTPEHDQYMTWRVQTTLRSADSERIELDLAWARAVAGSGTTSEGSATVTLTPGRSHLIDVVGTDPSQGLTCNYVTLRLTASRVPPSSRELFLHRLWLVREQDGIRTVSDPMEGIGPAGEEVAFRFRPLRWNLAGAMVSTGPGTLIDIDITGTVASESLHDGSIETTITVKREISRSNDGGSSRSGRGTLVMIGRAGEAGEVELPPERGEIQVSSDGQPLGPLARGLRRQGQYVLLDFTQFLAGSRTLLVVTVERLR
jgi:hypothetical protein